MARNAWLEIRESVWGSVSEDISNALPESVSVSGDVKYIAKNARLEMRESVDKSHVWVRTYEMHC